MWIAFKGSKFSRISYCSGGV